MDVEYYLIIMRAGEYMRLWSLDPRYLDSKGLVALWRESLLAKAVLEGKTKGYTKHPQLRRFRAHTSPIQAINFYISLIYKESLARGYSFDVTKFEPTPVTDLIEVSSGQIAYEREHLLSKLKVRDERLYKRLAKIDKPRQNSLFEIVEGGVEDWEMVIVNNLIESSHD